MNKVNWIDITNGMFVEVGFHRQDKVRRYQPTDASVKRLNKWLANSKDLEDVSFPHIAIGHITRVEVYLD